jgi:hypothetical protein
LDAESPSFLFFGDGPWAAELFTLTTFTPCLEGFLLSLKEGDASTCCFLSSLEAA